MPMILNNWFASKTRSDHDHVGISVVSCGNTIPGEVEQPVRIESIARQQRDNTDQGIRIFVASLMTPFLIEIFNQLTQEPKLCLLNRNQLTPLILPQ
jgi:hypothetical protein